MRQSSSIQIIIDQKQLEHLECFNCLVSTITKDSRCICEVKSRIVMAKAALNKKKTLSPQTNLT